MHKEKPGGPQSNCRRSKCAINKMPDGRHQSTYMVPTTIRWTQLARVTHKNCDDTHLHGNPLRTVSIRHRRNKGCVTIPQMPHRRHAHNNRSGQRTRTSRNISYLWENTTLLPMNYARCPRHIAPATCDTCVKKKKKDSGNTSPKTSIHHVTRALNRQRCERTCASCSKLATRGTQIDARNRNRRHERCSRAPQHDGSLANGSLRQPPHEPPQRNITSHTKKTPRKRTKCHVLSLRASSLCVHVSSEVARSCTIREGTTQDCARQSTRAPFAARHNEHGDVEANDDKERKATQDVTAPRRKLCNVGKARPHQRIRTLISDAPTWLGRPIHSHRASSKQS